MIILKLFSLYESFLQGAQSLFYHSTRDYHGMKVKPHVYITILVHFGKVYSFCDFSEVLKIPLHIKKELL